MTDEKDFTPRLGRIGSQTPLRQTTQLKRLARAARKGQPRAHSGGRLQAGAVRFQGRSKAAAVMARHWSHARQRRVVVKVHIARAGPAGNAAFARHLSYIHRDGTDRDGHRGTLYDREGEVSDATKFNERARDDRRQFRLIVSPEDSAQMTDLKAFTRALMDQAEKDLRQRLDWVAINHHDTAHPHVHIAIRGGSPRNAELIITGNTSHTGSGTAPKQKSRASLASGGSGKLPPAGPGRLNATRSHLSTGRFSECPQTA